MAGIFQHPCEGEAVCKLTNEKVPYFNAPIYLENITQVRCSSCAPTLCARLRHVLVAVVTALGLPTCNCRHADF